MEHCGEKQQSFLERSPRHVQKTASRRWKIHLVAISRCSVGHKEAVKLCKATQKPKVIHYISVESVSGSRVYWKRTLLWWRWHGIISKDGPCVTLSVGHTQRNNRLSTHPKQWRNSFPQLEGKYHTFYELEWTWMLPETIRSLSIIIQHFLLSRNWMFLHGRYHLGERTDNPPRTVNEAPTRDLFMSSLNSGLLLSAMLEYKIISWCDSMWKLGEVIFIHLECCHAAYADNLTLIWVIARANRTWLTQVNFLNYCGT